MLLCGTSQGASAAPQQADDRRIKPVISYVPIIRQHANYFNIL
jgi:hypothetical protein